MSTNKHIDRICIAIVIAIFALMGLVIVLYKNGVFTTRQYMGYEDRLFSTDKVHTIHIVMDDWDQFIEGCESEEYSAATVVIDGEKYSNIGIRAKGNTSLSNVKSMGSDRYSFKIEFDHYEDGKTYFGLDKLCLNNIIQDNTMMKDYLTYQMMRDFGVDAPLSSYVYITVNGEDWGLYLAVESVEDSFIKRNYGSDGGNIYKPDSTSIGGGRGNGKDFNMDDFTGDEETSGLDDNFTPPDFGGNFEDGNFTPPDFGGEASESVSENSKEDRNGGRSFGGFGMGSSDVKLQYIDDDPDSYSNIFSSAKTEITKADKTRLIASLKNLSEYTDLENTLDIEEVLRYFVVHNFVINGDSYTGSMIHNYYLYEKDGQLSMIPWDYNLAYGTFQGSDAYSVVNSSIDEPVSGGNVDDRPMVGWIFSDETYTAMYHELFQTFMEEWYVSGKMQQLITDTEEMIGQYVEKDPTKFCTTEEFKTGVNVLLQFVTLRSQAVMMQLESGSSDIDTSNITISDMGTMNMGDGNFGGPSEAPDFGGKDKPGNPGTDGAPSGDFDFKGKGPFENGGGAPSGMNSDSSSSTENRQAPANLNMQNREAFSVNNVNSSMNQYIWLAVSCAVLAVGLAIVISKK